jgi:hypothetical protein
MVRRWAVLAVALVALSPLAVRAEDEEASIEFFYPLVTRRPVIERELELRFSHDKGRDGRRNEAVAGIEFPILPRWQVELEVPAVFTDPREGPSAGGPGDIELQNKFLLLKSVEHKALVAAGFEFKFPSGSERRGLGGEAAVEPFLAAGIALGDFDLLADLAYEWNLNAHVQGEREQVLGAGGAIGYRAFRRFTPLVEVTTLSQTRGGESDAPSLRGKTQVYIIPGFNVRPLPGTTARFGVELPLTDARKSDYTLHGGFVWEF